MKKLINTLKDSLLSYQYLFGFEGYTGRDRFKKIIGLIIFIPIYTFLILFGFLFYCIERLLAPVFKLFIYGHLKLMQKRNVASPWKRRFASLLTLVFTLVLLPLVFAYYVSMLLKHFIKYLLKQIILFLDFTARYMVTSIVVLDDNQPQSGFSLGSLMKDTPETEALNQAIEAYLNQGDENKE